MDKDKEETMSGKNIQFKTLTIEEMSLIKGAGPNQDYIGPPVEEGGQDRAGEKNFFTSLAAFFTFDFSAFFGTTE
jgi:hypothetical protein